jgi:hypothetical protein
LAAKLYTTLNKQVKHLFTFHYFILIHSGIKKEEEGSGKHSDPKFDQRWGTVIPVPGKEGF